MEQLIELLKNVTLADGTTADLSQNLILVDVLTKAIAKGSQTEKDKLYPEIQTLKSQLAARVQTPPQQQPQQMGQPEIEATIARVLAQANPTTSPQYNASQPPQNPVGNGMTKEEVAGMIASVFNEKMPNLLQTQLSPIMEQLNDVKLENVEQYRNRKLLELGNTVIPELVKGATKEQVDASIVEATSIAAKYAVAQTATPVQPTSTAPTTVQPTVTTPTQTPTPTSVTREPNYANMSQADYAKSREAILAGLQAS
jgi:hypothetical protein